VLKGFDVPKYRDGKPRQYISDVHVISGMGDSASGRKPEVLHAKISVNHPLRWNGWWLYQSSYDASHESYTVIEAVRDPFLPMAALAVLGALFLLIVLKKILGAATRVR
jgi:cytochrome c biogenesis protein ResB